MEALNIGSGLFILACFLMVWNAWLLIAELAGYIACAIMKRKYDVDYALKSFLISVSFTYIMAYLFIW